MKEDRPSRTAFRTAMHRAAHQLVDEPVVFVDPLALSILGIERETARETNPGWLEGERELLACRIRALLAARSRYAEDELAGAVQRGTGQYVVLGAGLDTFACRNPYPGDALRVFEVDHPETQSWKRALLRDAGIPLPDALTLAPMDFEKEELGEVLARAGFDTGSCAFFSWLGVTQYIEKSAVEATLKYVASLPSGSGIVFDYTIHPSHMSPGARQAHETLARRVASAGEPFRTYFHPSDLMAGLTAMGFNRMEDVGPEELNARYFREHPGGLKVGGSTRLMNARV